MMLRNKAFGIALVSTCLIGCSSWPNRETPYLNSAFLNAPNTRAENLYVANLSTITVYAPGSDSVLRTITQVQPSTIAVSSSGDLYVANLPTGNSGNVTVYRAGTSSILRKITKGIDEPKALAFDSAGDLYVANSYFQVVIYRPGATSPSGSLHVFYPAAMVFDHTGDLYTASDPSPYGRGKSLVPIYAPDRKLLRTIEQGLSTPIALALSDTGNLFVANYVGNDVTVYLRGKTSVLRTISQGIKRPYALAFDASGNLYVANNAVSTVTLYAPGSSTLLRTIRLGVSRPTALIFDDSGNLYVANAKNVSVYAPGKGTPRQTIVKGINSPIAMSFGP
jgi:hypothetical protein